MFLFLSHFAKPLPPSLFLYPFIFFYTHITVYYLSLPLWCPCYFLLFSSIICPAVLLFPFSFATSNIYIYVLLSPNFAHVPFHALRWPLSASLFSCLPFCFPPCRHAGWWLWRTAQPSPRSCSEFSRTCQHCWVSSHAICLFASLSCCASLCVCVCVCVYVMCVQMSLDFLSTLMDFPINIYIELEVGKEGIAST